MEHEEKCPICLDIILNQPQKQKCCSKYFHSYCLKSWFKINKNCPLCRSEQKVITYDEYLEIRSEYNKINGSDYINIINNYLLVCYYTSKAPQKIIYNFLLFFKFIDHIMNV